MQALYILIPLSVALLFLAVWVFLRATNTGQFDDVKGSGMGIPQDEDRGASEEAPPEQTDKAS